MIFIFYKYIVHENLINKQNLNVVVRHKKGSFFFILDVFIGAFIFLVTLLLIFNIKLSQPETESLSLKLNSFTKIVFTDQISSYNNEYKDDVLAKSKETLPDPFMTADELIYYLHTNGYEENATLFVKNLTNVLLPNYIGINYSIGGEEIYSRFSQKLSFAKTSLTNKKITYKILDAETIRVLTPPR